MSAFSWYQDFHFLIRNGFKNGQNMSRGMFFQVKNVLFSHLEALAFFLQQFFLDILNLLLKIQLMNKKLEVDNWNNSFYGLKRKPTRANFVFLDFTAIWSPNFSVNTKIAKINLIQHNVHQVDHDNVE